MKSLSLLLLCGVSASAASIHLEVPSDTPSSQLEYALTVGKSVIEESGHHFSVEKVDGIILPEESYSIAHKEDALRITAADGSGAIYAMLDIAEKLQQGVALASVNEGLHQPRFPFRTIKYNLPWAAYRTAPYIEQHQETCRDLEYWRAFLDMMVENRLNTLSLWSLHPWHYMVRTPEFPEMSDFSDEELAEWHAFWTQLFALAEERGIETYLVNWNMYVSPAFSKAHDHIADWSQTGSHFGSGSEEQLLIDYTRATIAEVLRQYPGLTGLGITLGEHMGGMSPDERRDWLDQTVLAGIRDAGRPTKFLYRAPLSATKGSGGTTDVANDLATRAQVESLGEPFELPIFVEFKFNWSHGHSSPELHIVHGGKLSDAYFDPEPEKYKAVWTVRNEDFYRLRWGQPDFVRSFIEENGQSHTGGVIIGSEVFIPADDILTKEGPHRTWKWQFEKQWLFYSIWGRLLYDPETPDSTFARMFENRFPGSDGEKLLQAWKLASSVPLEMANFHQGSWDGSLYTEAFGRWVDGGEQVELFNINEFITHPVLDPAYMNIRDFVRGETWSRAGRLTPAHVVEKLAKDMVQLDDLLTDLQKDVSLESPLAAELADIEAWKFYGRYLVAKINAGIALDAARYQSSRLHFSKARAGLSRAVRFWESYAEAASRYNHDSFAFQTQKPMSLKAMIPQVKKDVALVDEYYPDGASWSTLSCKGEPHARHEAAFVECRGKLYLLGGRRIQAVDELDPVTGLWKSLAEPPLELHHFQAIERDGKIWIIGAMTGPYPNEKPVPNVYIFDPAANQWSKGPEIPEDRRRGGAGVVQHGGNVYIIGGIQRGHVGGYVPWLDRWDPASETWTILPDAPHARDHFQAAIIAGKIYAAGGRQTSKETEQVFALTVPEVDVYDIHNAEWSTVAEPLPTPRAGTSTIAINGYLVIAGGESATQKRAFREVEAYNPKTGLWIDWPFLKQGRHGSSLAELNGKLYTSSGSGQRGGRPELTTTEILSLTEGR